MSVKNSILSSLKKSESINDEPISDAFTDSDSSNSQSWGAYISSITWKTWAIIFFVFALLGFNIFTILSKSTDEATSIFRPFIKWFASIVLALTGQVIDVTAEGAKKVVNTGAAVVDKGAEVTDKTLTNIQSVVSPDTSSTITPTFIPNPQKRDMNNSSYEADDSTSSIQQGNNKAGWCYIGEDRNVRACAKVGYTDTCLSGDIFPSQEICMNPTLRP